MANVTVYNMEGNEVGTMELNDAVFGVEINEHLVHLAVVRQLANNRQGTQKAKTRSEVSGGGRKPQFQNPFFFCIAWKKRNYLNLWGCYDRRNIFLFNPASLFPGK